MPLSIEIANIDATHHWSLTPKPDWLAIPDEEHFYGLRYSTSMPGGYADCSFKLRRDPRFDYPDLGFYNRVTIYTGPKVVWDGEIRSIGQNKNGDGHELEIRCLGHNTILSDAPYNRVWADSRYGMWYINEVVTTNKFEKYIVDNNNRLMIATKKDVSYDNTFQAIWLYDLPFTADLIARVEYDYDVVIPAASNFKAQLLSHSNQGRTADQAILTNITATGSATGQSVNLGTSRQFLSWRFFVDSAVPYVETGADGTNYAKLTNITVKTTTGSINAQIIGQDIVSKYSAAAYGLSSDNGFVSAVMLDLSPIAFDEDWTAEDVLNMVAEMGDGSTPPKPVGWYIFDDKKLYLETLDYTNVKYLLDRDDAEISVQGDIQAAYQQAFARYQNAIGRVVRTATRDVFTDVITTLSDPWSGRKRIKPLDAQFTTSSGRAQSWADLWLVRNGLPIGKTSYTVKGGYISDRYGQMIPLAEVRADGLLEVPRFKAFEAAVPSATDVRDRVSVDYLVYTEYDYDSDTLVMTPGEPSPTFQRQLAALRKRIGPDAGYLQRKLVGLPTA